MIDCWFLLTNYWQTLRPVLPPSRWADCNPISIVFPFGEVLATDLCYANAQFRYKMIVLCDILSILTDIDNGSTLNTDVPILPNLDQILTVGSCWKCGTQIQVWQKIVLLIGKSCWEGPGSLIIQKYGYERGWPCVNICDSATIGAIRASETWKNAPKPLKIAVLGCFWQNRQVQDTPESSCDFLWQNSPQGCLVPC